MNRYTVNVTVEVEAENEHEAYRVVRASWRPTCAESAARIVDQEVAESLSLDSACDDCGLVSCGCQ